MEGEGKKEEVMKQLLIVFLLAFGLVGASSGLEKSRQSNKFFNRDVGFAIAKHPDWHFLSLDNAETWMSPSKDTEEERANLQKYLQNLREQESKTGMAPLFIAKHPEPYPHLNPMIKVVLHYVDDLRRTCPRSRLRRSWPKVFRRVIKDSR